MIRMVIGDAAPLFRCGLVALLSGMSDFEVVAATSSAKEVVQAGLELRPDVALLDVDLPDADGFAASGALHDEVPECTSVLMASRCRPGDVRRAADAHALGLVLKDTSPDGLVAAIRKVARGQRVVDPDLAFTELSAAENPLTERERQVLVLASQGESTDQIADTLLLAIGTVRNHLAHINGKLGARNRVHAIRIAEEAGWL
ncbi:LuxR C-terminal-related transcriptional regulator [Spirillospora sp. NPDC048911]|uniref:LuxR C-terminal-related transcriptional regulator n=1 Tax=Spirillospora sp. NPDC048911 TaxID=3364527 RepID=UPI0037230875